MKKPLTLTRETHPRNSGYENPTSMHLYLISEFDPPHARNGGMLGKRRWPPIKMSRKLLQRISKRDLGVLREEIRDCQMPAKIEALEDLYVRQIPGGMICFSRHDCSVTIVYFCDHKFHELYPSDNQCRSV